MLGEAVGLSLAERAGIDTAPWRIEGVGETNTLLVRRFDRDGARRIPFLSAMSMLGAADNEPHSYLEIAEALQRFGAATKADLVALWRRIVFNVLISNTDDHLRNHGFLYDGPKGWRLSPAYDLNPVPEDVKPRILSTAIMPDDPSASLDLAFEAAEYFGVSRHDARPIAAEVAEAVATWRSVAKDLGLSSKEIGRMASAFQHGVLSKALA
ncbi:MAG: HipA domain-containing protein [Devosia sp.]